MKFSQCQFKQIRTRGRFQNKAYKKSFRTINQNTGPLCSTQTIFSSINKKSLKTIDNQFQNQKCQKELYQTFGNTNWENWVRPQSKHACRKMFTRPQTSKGFRTMQVSNNNFVWQQKKPMSRKRQSKKEVEGHKQNNPDTYQQVQIIVNKKSGYKKGESIHKNKFQTDLDDEFLELFAD